MARVLIIPPEWHARIAKGCAVGVACIVSFAAGIGFRRPPETKTVERVEYRDRWHEAKKAEATEAKRVVVYRDRIVKPDGTRVEREVERTDTDKHDVETTTRTEDREGVRTAEVTVTPHRPDWHVGAMAGAGIQLAPSLSAAFEVGAHVERRIVGPAFVGAWVLAKPGVGLAVGASVSLEF